MIDITIYSKNGTEKAVVKTLEYEGNFMGDRFVTVSVSSPTVIDWAIGDYLDYRGERWTLWLLPATSKTARVRSYGGAIEYKDLRFCPNEEELRRCSFLDVVKSDNEIHYTSLPNFSFYCSRAQDLADRIQANLDRLYPGLWTVEANEAASITDQSLTFSENSCWDALVTANTTLGLNFIIDSAARTITIGGEGFFIETVMQYGEGNGLKSVERTVDDNQQVINRLYAYGNTRNLPYRYYNKRYAAGSSVFDMVQSMYLPNLMLPGICKGWAANEATGYLDANGCVYKDYGAEGQELTYNSSTHWYNNPDGSAYVGTIYRYWKHYSLSTDRTMYYCDRVWIESSDSVSKCGIQEGTKFFDGSDELTEDIYPSLTGFDSTADLASALGQQQATTQNLSYEQGALDEIMGAIVDSWDGIIPEEEEATPTFSIRIKNIGFDLGDAELDASGDTPRLSMKSGMCAGREFNILECKKQVQRNGAWEDYNPSSPVSGQWSYLLTCEVAADESIGQYFPNNSFTLAPGDRFVILGIKMPDVYVDVAENRLLKVAIVWLSENDKTSYSYMPAINNIYMKDNPETSALLKEGNILHVYDEDLGIDVEMTISNLKIKNDKQIPEFEVTLSNDKEADLVQRVTAQVRQSFTQFIGSGKGSGSGIYLIGTTSNAAPTDNNAFSARRSLNMFLRKDVDDTASGHITFNQGLTSEKNANLAAGSTFGLFTSGLLGSGACIDRRGDAEVNSLYSREFISTPEFRFNKVTVTEGEQWNTNGFGTIIDVDYENQIISLKLEEGEYSSIKVGDICRGIYNMIGYNQENPDNQKNYNTSEVDEDECKFPTKAGFFTSYFWVKEVLTPHTAGEFRFVYETKSQQVDDTDTTPHPCKNMKFAQYGSFNNVNRQSSMYMTSIRHNYIQLLEGVNTWEIRPANIVSRYGYLGNLTITLKNTDGSTYNRTLEGNGLYVQDNVYFGNSVIQLDPVTLADLADIMGNYQVYLSSYTDVIKVDDAGNVIDGLWTEEELNDGTTLRRYRIHTAVTVRKGNTILREAADGETVGKGTYKVMCVPNDCQCLFESSTLYITHINNVKDGIAGSSDDVNFDYAACRAMERVWVDIVVDCEGEGTIVQTVPVTIKHDPMPYIMADLTNENAGISWSTLNGAYVGLPITTKISMAKGNEALPITNMAVSSINGVTPEWVGYGQLNLSGTVTRRTADGWRFSFNTDTGIFSVISAPYDLPAVSEILLTITTTYVGVSYERTLSLHIMRSEDMAIYDLITRPNTVNVDKNAVMNYEDITLEIYRTTTSNGREKVTSLPTGFSLKYKVTRNTTDGTVVGTETAMEYDDGESVFAVDDPAWVNDIAAVEFTLYNGSGDVEDSEGVPIVREGVGGQGSVGPAGKGIYSITERYLNTKRSTGVTKNTVLDNENDNGTWGETFVAPSATYPYTWRYTIYRYTDDTTSDTGLNCELIATYSEDGKGITNIDIWYLKTTLGTGVTRPANPVTAGWTNNYSAPNGTQKYVWRFYDFTYSDDTHVYSACELVSVYVKDGMGTQDAYTVVDEGVTPTITDATGSLPVSASPIVWQLGTNGLNVATGKCLWMSERAYDGSAYGNWGTPVRISGDKGEQGRDGKNIEFIYKRSGELPTANDKPANDHKDQDGYVPDGWQPSPLGVSSQAGCKYEWMCQRIKAVGASEWGNWSDVVVWSAYGDKGTDGDGVEYVFKRMTNSTAPSRPSSSSGTTNSDGEFIPTGWTDNPLGVGWADTNNDGEADTLYLFEWVSVRKKINGTWTAFSVPALWATYSETPDLRIVNGYWYIGNSPLLDNNGNPVKAEGQDGTGIALKGSKEVLYTTTGKTALEDVSNAELGDCWVVDANRHLYVFVGGSTFPNNWKDMGEFRGEPGQDGEDGLDSWVHFAWANGITFDEDGETLLSYDEFSLVKGESEYEWMGICTDHSPDDPGIERWTEYKWNHIKGMDGANYERVYMRTKVETAPTISYTSYTEDGKPVTKNDDEYRPSVGNKNTCQAALSRFTDDPNGVSETYPFEWMAERKKTNDTWGDFSAASLWAKYSFDGENGENGQSVFKAFVFCRYATKPTTPTGGSYSSPLPLPEQSVTTTPPTWSSGIPTGANPLWMSSRIFTSDGQSPQQSGWTEPVLMADTESFDVEFSPNEIDDEPAAPNGTNQSGSGKIWYDPTTDVASFATLEMKWMATRTRTINSNGVPVWSSWVVVCTKGNTGQKGDTGSKGDSVTSVTTYYLKTTLYTNVNAPTTQNPETAGWSTSYNPPDEDQPYVWRFTRTTIENKSPINSACELIAIYSPSPNINLLDDTAFSSDDAMEAWTTKGSVGGDSHANPNSTHYNEGNEGYENYFRIDGGTQAHNSYHGHFRGAETGYINFLAQPLYVAGTVEKIEPDTWYTLSFWLKGSRLTDYASDVVFQIYFAMTNLVTTASGEYMYVDGQRVTSNQNVRMFTPTVNWEKHVITFKTPATLVDNTYAKWDMFDTAYTQDVYICMPKLERGMVATTYTDSSASNKVVVRNSHWKAGEKYYAGNPGERFLDVVECGGSWSRCKKTHISYDGSTIDGVETVDNRPGSTAGRLLWMSGGNYKFLATEVFFAREAAIENLIATILRTGAVGVPHVEMEGSSVKFFGTLTTPSIELLADADGNGFLRFYDKDGYVLYDLGPNKIMENFNAVASSYTSKYYKAISSSSGIGAVVHIGNSAVTGLVNSDCTEYHQLIEGHKVIQTGSNNVMRYNISNGSLPSSWSGRLFTGQPSDETLQSATLSSYNGFIPNGWYSPSTGGGVEQDISGPNDDMFLVRFHKYYNGIKQREVVAYYNPSELIANRLFYYDESGTRHRSLGDILID